MELSIILVNYNGLSYVAACLDSIRQFAPANSEVIMVDNGSRDGSPSLVSRDYPWVQLIKSESNLGFALGNNLAAMRASGKIMLLLNTDTVLLEPLAPALQWLEEHPDYGILTIDMVDDQRISRACTGRFPTPVRLAFLRAMLVDPGKYTGKQACEVDWVQGSFLLIRTDLWRALGGLDGRYFMYSEDVDLCKRAHNLGRKCGILPGIRYIHIGGFNPARFPTQVASLSLYVERHMQGSQRLCAMSVLFFGCLARVIWYQIRAVTLRNQTSRVVAQACREALAGLLPAQRHARPNESGAGS